DEGLNKRQQRQAQLCVQAVQTAFDLVLDYKDSSIRTLDQVIVKGWGNKNVSNQSKERVIATFGAYFGQTFINNHGGMWYEHSKEHLEPIVFVPRANFEFSPYKILREKFDRMNFYDLNIAYIDLVNRMNQKLNAFI
ncbi:MAG: hypothetical protein N3A61_00750, partial [Ignavibacteria bacterium]|nr:hypothetical protein [Ignavibacteria bacterium]